MARETCALDGLRGHPAGQYGQARRAELTENFRPIGR